MTTDITNTPVNQNGQAIQCVSIGLSSDFSYSSTAGISSSFSQGVTVVRLVSTTDCRIKFGSNPTADSTSTILCAGCAEFFLVTPGHKVSAIRITDDGLLNVTEC